MELELDESIELERKRHSDRCSGRVECLRPLKKAREKIISDEGPCHPSSDPESGRLCRLRAPVTDVHKPVVSTSRETSTNTIAILDSEAEALISSESPPARKFMKLTQRELRKRSVDGVTRLHMEQWVCIFYVWHSVNSRQADNFVAVRLRVFFPNSVCRNTHQVFIGRQHGCKTNWHCNWNVGKQGGKESPVNNSGQECVDGADMQLEEHRRVKL